MSDGMTENILGKISFIDMGQSPDSFFYNEEEIGLPLIQGNADIKERKSIKRIWVSQPTKVCDAGDILMTVRAPVGFVGIASFTSCIGRGVCSIKANGVDEKYLYYLLISQEDNWKAFEQGSTFTAVGSKEVFNFPLMVVNSETVQRRIAHILTTTDAVIEKTQTAIAKYKAIKQGFLHDLFTRGIDLTTNKLRPCYEDAPDLYKESKLGWIPKEWKVITVEEFASDDKNAIVDGPFGSNLKTIHYRSSGVPVIQSGFVTSNIFRAQNYLYVDKEKFESEIRSKTVPGDIIMAKIGAQCGTCAILPKNHPIGILAGNCLKITVAKHNSNKYFEAYLHFLYETSIINNIISTTAQPAVSMSSLKVLPIKYPKPKEQEAISERIETVKNKIQSEQTYLHKLNNIKKGLMEDLLSGKKLVQVPEELVTQNGN